MVNTLNSTITGLDNWTRLLDWTTGLDYWTGLLDWTTGLDYWTTGLDYWTHPNCKIHLVQCRTEVKRTYSLSYFTNTAPFGWVQSLDWTTGLDYWTGLLDWTTGLLDWTTGLDYWTTGLDYWIGLLDYWIGLLDSTKLPQNALFGAGKVLVHSRVSTLCRHAW